MIWAVAITPPEIYKPSEISAAFQEVGFTGLLLVIPQTFIVTGSRHHFFSEIPETSTRPKATPSVQVLFGAASIAATLQAGDCGATLALIGMVRLDGVLKV